MTRAPGNHDFGPSWQVPPPPIPAPTEPRVVSSVVEFEALKADADARVFFIGDIPARFRNDWVLSIDLGKKSDNTAMSLINRVITGTGQWVDDVRLGKSREREIIAYRILDLKNIPLGTPYATVARMTRDAVKRAEDAIGIKPDVLIDGTGLGTAAVEFFDAELLFPKLVVISGGNEPQKLDYRTTSVPKSILVENFEALLDADQVKAIGDTDAALLLQDQLRKFERRLTVTGRPTWDVRESMGHDDLLMSVIQGCYYLSVLPPSAVQTPLGI